MIHDDQPILSTDHGEITWPSNRVDVLGFLQDCLAFAEGGPNEPRLYFLMDEFLSDVVEAAEHALRTNTDTKMNDVRNAWMNAGQS